MDQSSRTLRKLLRVLQFRQHLKELTSACKRINKDGCYEFVTARTEPLSSPRRSRSEIRSKRRSKSSGPLNRNHVETLTNADHLSRATAQSPANLPMIVCQSYKPLHVKSSQLDKNLIAVTKGTFVKALYKNGNWVFIENVQIGQTGYAPLYCLEFVEASSPSSSSRDNISLLNVSIYEKNDQVLPSDTASGRFVSSIGTCHFNVDHTISTCPRSIKSQTFQRHVLNDQSALSREISQMSLHANDHDIYQSFVHPTCIIAPPIKPLIHRRRRAIEGYQKQFVGDISVLESEVLTLLDEIDSNDDWHLVRRGDGKQGYVPKHILMVDQTLS